jgi:hypothetical protein
LSCVVTLLRPSTSIKITGCPNSAHLIVENGGHETLPSGEVQSVVVDFFKGRDVRGRVVAFERPRFLSVEEAKAQATARR